MARACSGLGSDPGQHVEVVGGEAEVVAWLHGLLPLPQPVRRGQDRRHDRAQPERLVVQLVGADVVRRAPAELGRQQRDRGAQHVERRAAAAHGGQHRAQPGGQGTPAPDLRAEGRRGGRVGQLAPEEEVPDVLERALLGQLDRGVLAVVEEALLAAHVADGRLGHHHALEPGRHVAARLAGGPDPGHGHEVAQRHDADAAAPLDHRQMAVVVRGQARPRRVGPLVGTEHVGPGGHPQTYPLAFGAALPGRRPQEVALGEDAHHLAVVGHDDRAGVGLLHRPGGHRQAVVGGARHRGGGHEITHDGFHASHYDALSLRL